MSYPLLLDGKGCDVDTTVDTWIAYMEFLDTSHVRVVLVATRFPQFSHDLAHTTVGKVSR